MLRQPVRVALVLLTLFSARAWLIGGDDKPDPAAVRQTARDALTKLDKGWKPYDNKPNLSDPRWKVQMEVLVKVVRAGPAAAPVLEEAAKKSSPWADSTRAFAAKALPVVRGSAAVRKVIASYDLSEMDTARVGKPAPNFTLPDASGETYRLSQFRRKKVVVLVFVVADT